VAPLISYGASGVRAVSPNGVLGDPSGASPQEEEEVLGEEELQLPEEELPEEEELLLLEEELPEGEALPYRMTDYKDDAVEELNPLQRPVGTDRKS
jgi:hypothetical protein